MTEQKVSDGTGIKEVEVKQVAPGTTGADMDKGRKAPAKKAARKATPKLAAGTKAAPAETKAGVIVAALKGKKSGMTVTALQAKTGYTDRGVRGGIDAARYRGYRIKNTGAGTFTLLAANPNTGNTPVKARTAFISGASRKTTKRVKKGGTKK